MTSGVDGERPGSALATASPWWRRWWFLVPALLAAYVALSFVNDPRGSLGTDTGGKAATVKVMSERGDLSPDVGSWASAYDDPPTVHDLIFTTKIGDRYVQVTTLPMVLAARPLWDVAGYRGALLLPMLGAVLAATAARAIARRLGDGDGAVAFWVTGLASPVLLYALDLWEHSLGLGLMAWGVVVLWDVADDRRPWPLAVLGGLAFGVAFSMRTEAAAYAVAVIGVTAVALLVRRRFGPAVGAGLAASVGAGIGLVANQVLEHAVLGQSIRSGRAVGTVQAGGQDLALRAREAIITGLGLMPADDPQSLAMAVVAAVALVAAAWLAAQQRRDLALVAFGVAVALYVLRAVAGPGFVPGLVATTPLAAVALALAWRSPGARMVVLYALVPLPLVLAFQFAGGALPQWGGRYILLSGLLLGATGVAVRGPMVPAVRRGFVGLAVAVTAFGLVWMSIRTHAYADLGDRLERPSVEGDVVLVAANGFLPREFGATYPRARWLAAPSRAQLDDALAIAARVGPAEIQVVTDPDRPPPDIAGYRRSGTRTEPVLAGVDLLVTTYRSERATTGGEST